MEGRVPKMWDILNITHNQYLELSMKLDLRINAPRARDWTEFAEWTGSSFCFIMIFACMFELTCIPTIILDSDPLLSNFTANLQEEQFNFTMQFSLENNEIILQDFFFFNLFDLCFVTFKETGSYISSFFKI